MRRLGAIAVILFLLPLGLMAQPQKKAVPELEFAKLDSNRIVFEGDSSAFEKFFNKLDSVIFLEKGKVNILHAGGSHVQGGTFTRELRNDLLSIRPLLDGGRGMVFPYSAAKTNNPSSFRTRREGEWEAAKSTQKDLTKRLGLTGMAITTADSTASFTIVLHPKEYLPGEQTFSFNDVKVLGYADGDRVPVVVFPDGDTLVSPSFRDDSCWVFHLPPSDSVKISTKGTAGSFTFTGVCLENPYPGITVTGTGVNGASLVSYSKLQDFERDLSLVKPDLAVLAIGVNDASASGFSEEVFKTRYKAFVQRIRSVNPDCAILFVTNNDTFRHSRRKGYYVNPNGELAEHAFLELGEECGGGVWDLFNIMGGLGSMKKWESKGLARRDKIHFTDEGYVILGDLLYNALMDKYIQHLKRREV